MGDEIYRHALNKGGLELILSHQRLLATEARGIRDVELARLHQHSPPHMNRRLISLPLRIPRCSNCLPFHLTDQP